MAHAKHVTLYNCKQLSLVEQFWMIFTHNTTIQDLHVRLICLSSLYESSLMIGAVAGADRSTCETLIPSSVLDCSIPVSFS